MGNNSIKDGVRVRLDSRLLYCLAVALVGFVVRMESHNSASDTRLMQLERRTDTIEADIKIIKESLYEIRGDVKLLIKDGIR